MKTLVIKKKPQEISESTSFWSRFKRLSESRKNPRSESYMQSLLPSLSYPQVETENLTRKMISDAEELILLWNDGNGSGWMGDEFKILFSKNSRAKVRVLNGRRRDFELTFSNWPAFLWRRFLERFWIGEAVLGTTLILLFPFLWVKDSVRGQK